MSIQVQKRQPLSDSLQRYAEETRAPGNFVDWLECAFFPGGLESGFLREALGHQTGKPG